MKITSPGHLHLRLDKSLVWRKKEMTQQKLMADAADPGGAHVLRRSGITLMYAHWEGFIKEASVWYLYLLAHRPLDVSQLRPCFAAIALKADIMTSGQAKRTSAHARLVELFRLIDGPPGLQRKLPVKQVIATRANLKSGVLREIFVTLGLDYADFELKETPVIDRLAALRNMVAHGQGRPVDEVDYNFLHSEVILLLDKYKDLIADAAQNNRHIR